VAGGYWLGAAEENKCEEGPGAGTVHHGVND
jgi:hypothetical protein